MDLGVRPERIGEVGSIEHQGAIDEDVDVLAQPPGFVDQVVRQPGVDAVESDDELGDARRVDVGVVQVGEEATEVAREADAGHPPIVDRRGRQPERYATLRA